MKGSQAFNSIAAALFSSGAFALLVAAGMNSSFISVIAKPYQTLANPDDSKNTTLLSTSIGIFGAGDFYNIRSDGMWILCFTLICIAIGLTGVSTLIAWGISTFWAPTARIWKALSVLSALASVLQVPIFLMFDTFPCSAFRAQQTCQLSNGSYCLVSSTVCSIVATFITQFLDPPMWGSHLYPWKSRKKGLSDTSDSSLGSSSVYNKAQKSGDVMSFFQYAMQRQDPKLVGKPTTLKNDRASSEDDVESGEVEWNEDTYRASWAIFPRGPFDRRANQSLRPYMSMESPTTRSLSDSMSISPTPKGTLIRSCLPSSPTDGNDSILDQTKGEESVLDRSYYTQESIDSEEEKNEDSFLQSVELQEKVKIEGRQIQQRVQPIFTPFVSPMMVSDDEEETVESRTHEFVPAISPSRKRDFSTILTDRKRNFDTQQSANTIRIESDSDNLMDDEYDYCPKVIAPTDPIRVDGSAGSLRAGYDKVYEEILLKDWNSLHGDRVPKLTSRLPSRSISPPGADEVYPDPEPSWYDSDLSDEDEISHFSSAKDDEATVVSEILRLNKERRRNRRRKRVKLKNITPVGSVASFNTPLVNVIQEETQNDIDEEIIELEKEETKEDPATTSDTPYERIPITHRPSTPNLVTLHGLANKPKVCRDVHMDALNKYHNVETWFEDEKKSRDERFSTFAPPASVVKAHTTPLFKQNRLERGGIHALASFSSDDSQTDNEQQMPSDYSHQARQARIERLQNVKRVVRSQSLPQRNHRGNAVAVERKSSAEESVTSVYYNEECNTSDAYQVSSASLPVVSRPDDTQRTSLEPDGYILSDQPRIRTMLV
jgi:hypothetical protein